MLEYITRAKFHNQHVHGAIDQSFLLIERSYTIIYVFAKTILILTSWYLMNHSKPVGGRKSEGSRYCYTVDTIVSYNVLKQWLCCRIEKQS